MATPSPVNHQSLSSMERRLKAYTLAAIDLRLASNACDFVAKHAPTEEHELYYFLTLAAVVSYARPFSANKPHLQLPKACTQFRTPEMREAHKTAIAMRNKVGSSP